MRRVKPRREEQPPAEMAAAVQGGGLISRTIDAEAGDARMPCLLELRYSARDPLAVVVALCARSHAVVIERTAARGDLRDALQRRVFYPDLVMTPDTLRGRMLFRFHETSIAITVATDMRDVADFVRASDRLVPPSAELEAINAALPLIERDVADTPR